MLEFTNEQSYKTPMNLTLQVNDEQYQQKQHFRVLKRCSENMLQIYKKPPMAKSDFNKVATEVTLWHGRSLVNLLRIFRTPFFYEHHWRAVSAPVQATSGTQLTDLFIFEEK